MRESAIVASLLATSLLLAGCVSDNGGGTEVPTNDWNAVVEAAKDEGVLTIYFASHDGINAPLVEAFMKAYPEIEVNYVRLDSGALTARVGSEIEAGAPTADIIQLADNLLFEEHPDWFRPLAGIPNVEKFPSERVKGHYVHQQAAPFVVTYNTALVNNPPQTWAQLSEHPQIGDGLMVDPRAANSFMGWATFIRTEIGDDLLQTLATNAGGFFDSTATAAQQVTAGEVPLAFPNVREHTTAARAQGAPVETVALTPSVAVTNIYAAPKAGTSPNAAAVFVDFVLSRDAGAITCLNGDYRPFAYDDIPGCPVADPSTKILAEYFPKVNETTKAEILSLMGLQ